MLGFWAVVAVFVAISFAFLLPPLLRNRETSGIVARKDLTVTVYQDQFAELENDLKNEVISKDQYDQAKIDLEKNLLEDMGKADQLDTMDKVAPQSSGSKIAAGIIIIFIPIVSISLYNNWGGGAAAIDPESVPQEVKNEQHTQDIEGMLNTLVARLEQDPDDGEGWYMLGRTYQFLKRYPESVAAYEKSLPLGGNQSADVLSSYADAIAMASNRTLTDKAIDVLKQAVALDPKHVKSLWLLGTAAYQEQNYPVALQYWERLYKVLPPDSDEANQIAGNIGEIRSMMGMPPMANIPASPAVEAAPEMSDARIQGTVSLGGAVASKVSPEDTVFVFARAASGPRMPLAIVRKQVKDIPFDFTLDDSLAMNPSMRLSSVPKVVVGARVSKTGNAMPQPGDLEVISAVLDVNQSSPLNLIINKVIK
jgi:cytochrome c-type biogenesis protein CcmH